MRNDKRCTQCGRRKPRSVEECHAYQREPLKRTCFTGWGCIDPECAPIASDRQNVVIARLRSQLAEVVPILKHMAEPFCWETDWLPSSPGCGRCLHCKARGLLQKLRPTG